MAKILSHERRHGLVTIAGVCLFLATITWLVFGRTLRYDFVNYDDPVYVYDNPQVTGGLTAHGVIWAFTSGPANNWHPLTWLTHMLDYQVYGRNAGGHHFTNVLLHTIAVLLLFLVFAQMTGALWRSAFVAALFAIHPLHVESVLCDDVDLVCVRADVQTDAGDAALCAFAPGLLAAGTPAKVVSAESKRKTGPSATQFLAHHAINS